MLFLEISFSFCFFCFLSMHFVAGLILSTIFQTAHVMPDCEYPEPNEDETIENNWAIHQLQTTTNYKSNKLFSWYIGGLNYQVEHHLFQRFVMYTIQLLSKIVQRKAKEYDLPYFCQKIMLRQYGNMAKCSTDLNCMIKNRFKSGFFYHASAVGPPKERGITSGSTSFI